MQTFYYLSSFVGSRTNKIDITAMLSTLTPTAITRKCSLTSSQDKPSPVQFCQLLCAEFAPFTGVETEYELPRPAAIISLPDTLFLPMSSYMG